MPVELEGKCIQGIWVIRCLVRPIFLLEGGDLSATSRTAPLSLMLPDSVKTFGTNPEHPSGCSRWTRHHPSRAPATRPAPVSAAESHLQRRVASV